MDSQYAELLEEIANKDSERPSTVPNSKDWTESEWENYLSSIETPLRENQVSVDHYDRLVNESEVSIFSSAQEAANEELVSEVKSAIAKLPFSQQRVVQLTFFDLKSSREIAKQLGVSQTAVCNLKKRAIRNLRKSLVGVFTFPLVSKQEQQK